MSDKIKILAIESSCDEKIAAVWDVKAKNSEIYDYDAANDKFLFSEGTAGTAVNQEKLASALTDAALNGTYDAVIAVEADIRG